MGPKLKKPFEKAEANGRPRNIKNGRSRKSPLNHAILRSREKFLRCFPAGFEDTKYLQWERDYKWNAHQRWSEDLNRDEYRSLLIKGRYTEIADRAVSIESRTNLLFSFEKMAIRDAVRSISGACAFATGLYEFLYGQGSEKEKFNRWCSVVSALPRKKTRVFTWPVVTVFSFIAVPEKHVFLKPQVTRVAADTYAYPFLYRPSPSWNVYESLLRFVAAIQQDLCDLKPRDMIDLQSFIWVLGSDEYHE